MNNGGGMSVGQESISFINFLVSQLNIFIVKEKVKTN